MHAFHDYFQMNSHDNGKPEPEPKPVADEAVYRVLKLLRQNGIPCFLPDDLLDKDTERLIKGKG